MKSTMLALLVLLLASGVFCQEQKIPFTQVPDVVFKTFHSQFGSVQKSEWVKLEGNRYRVAFFILRNKHPHTAVYDSTGNWLQKNIEIEFSQLPMTVIESVVRQYEVFKPLTSLRLETQGCETVYRVTVLKWQTGKEDLKQCYALEFSRDGELLKAPELLARVNTGE